MSTNIEYIGFNVDLKKEELQPLKTYIKYTNETYFGKPISPELLKIATPFDFSIRKQGEEKKISSISFFVKEKYIQSLFFDVAEILKKQGYNLDTSIADEFYSISRGYDINIFYAPIISIKNINSIKTCALYLNTLKDKSLEREHFLKSISYSNRYNFDSVALSFIKNLVEIGTTKIFTNAYEFKNEALVRKYYFKIRDVIAFKKACDRFIPYVPLDINNYRLCEVSISSENKLGFYYKPKEKS